MFGVNPTVAAAYTLVLHAALWLPITLLGIWYMAYQNLSWQDFGKAVAETQPGPMASDQASTTRPVQISLLPQPPENDKL